MLENSTFSRKSTGQIDGQKYIFITKGFFTQNTDIIDAQTNKKVGEITYNNWMTKATITTNEQLINWKYDNIWNTRWSLFSSDGIEIKCSGSSLSGKMESNTEDALHLLCGLFVTNYYWQTSIAIMLAAFVPIWISVIN